MMCFLFAAAAMCCLGFAQQAAAQTLSNTVQIADANEEKPQDWDSSYLDKMNETGVERDSCGGNGEKSLLNASVEQGLGVVSNDDLSGYLNGIVKKLLAVSPIPDCSVTVYVTPHDAAQAVALADGGILVAIGFCGT